MSHSVPTLLGILVILLFALLVLGVYQTTVYSRLGQGQAVVGLAGQALLTGVEPPHEDLAGAVALAPAPQRAVWRGHPRPPQRAADRVPAVGRHSGPPGRVRGSRRGHLRR